MTAVSQPSPERTLKIMYLRKPFAAAHTARRAVAWILTVAMLCAPLGVITAARAQAPVAATNNPTVNGPALPPSLPPFLPDYGSASILLFPFNNDTNSADTDAVAAQVTDALRLRLNAVGAYKVTTYTKFLSPVQRALADGVLAQTDIAGPFDPQKGGKIAGQVGTNYYLTGAVESYTADAATRRVTVEVSADLRSTRTGNNIRTLAFTGSSAPFSYSDTLDMVSQRAVDDAASKLAAALDEGRRTTSVLPSSQRGHSNAGQVFLLTVLASALAFAVLHNSGGGSSSSGSTTTTTTTSSGSGSSSSGSSGPPAPPGLSGH